MHDSGPIFIVEPRSQGADWMSVTIPCDDAEHFVRTVRQASASGRLVVTAAHSVTPGEYITLIFSFPGLLRPVHLTGIIGRTVGGDRHETAIDGRGVKVDLVDFDTEAEKRLSELIEKVEERDAEYVARAVRVLVVEDNPHCAKLIQEGLHLAGKRAFGNRVVFDVPMASNAADAFTFLHSRPIDVLITDIYLGGVSGTTVIEHVRRDSGLRSIPVIAISAGDEATKQVAMEAGADVFLPKPVRLRQIVGTVGRVLNLEQVAWR